MEETQNAAQNQEAPPTSSAPEPAAAQAVPESKPKDHGMTVHKGTQDGTVDHTKLTAHDLSPHPAMAAASYVNPPLGPPIKK